MGRYVKTPGCTGILLKSNALESPYLLGAHYCTAPYSDPVHTIKEGNDTAPARMFLIIKR